MISLVQWFYAEFWNFANLAMVICYASSILIGGSPDITTWWPQDFRRILGLVNFFFLLDSSHEKYQKFKHTYWIWTVLTDGSYSHADSLSLHTGSVLLGREASLDRSCTRAATKLASVSRQRRCYKHQPGCRLPGKGHKIVIISWDKSTSI